MKREIKFQFQEFKKYANFLLGDLNLQKELSASFLEQISYSHLPMIQFLSKLPSPQSMSLIQSDFQCFLEQSLKDNALQLAVEKVNMWRDRNFSRSYIKE